MEGDLELTARKIKVIELVCKVKKIKESYQKREENKTLKSPWNEKNVKSENDDLRNQLSVSMSQILNTIDKDEEKSVKASSSSSENVRNYNHTRRDLDAAMEELKQIEETLNNK